MNLTRALPLVVIAGLGYMQRDALAETAYVVVDLAKVVIAHHELRNLETAVRAENTSGNLLEVTSDFQGFVRRISESDQKDAADDPWGSPYEVRFDASELRIISLGRDGIERTTDDVVVRISLLN